MAGFVARLFVIIVPGFINLSSAELVYAALGKSLTLPFYPDRLEASHILSWTHNSTIIFKRQQGRVSVGKQTDISETGSLLLKNLQFSSAGSYEANLQHPNVTKAISWIAHLVVIDQVPKPQLSFTCDLKSSAVNLNCFVGNPHGLEFSWSLNDTNLTTERRQQLRISLAQLEGARYLRCSVANKISKEMSGIVTPTCPSPTPPPLLCFTSKTVLAALIGGAFLILLLLTVIILLCCRHIRHKSQVRSTDKGDIRMLYVGKGETDAFSLDYETMHPSEQSLPPGPEPSSAPRTCYEMVPQHEPTENKHLQPSTAGAEKRPSPVPKPRTKRPRNNNM